eukprot:Plantae.Rhodophyta-Hildenbrandia_rubra.ctg31103.p1 GENE.Plantae.Rhodophyta-Hildenbrandia_rubra.ctg31103~~Plantae.Rhodophyta-Hildenbrandia_rubra.ctg31103.p1  ORF type:complete len:286 (+),score=43.95 Plantae.Rhodophyta-Hildenbrandia_rubra.ctg31103:257-1114(+)
MVVGRRALFSLTLGCTALTGTQAAYLNFTYTSPPVPQGPHNGIESPSATAQALRNKITRRILVIGDSLAAGVGGEGSFPGNNIGPALPRSVARTLSKLWGEQVGWHAVGISGGDVGVMRRELLPAVRKLKESGEEIAAVVLVCGVNDWKRVSILRTDYRFAQELVLLIKRLRDIVGKECAIILPAIPGVAEAPRFHDPLRSLLVLLNDRWDSQKERLADTMEKVHYVCNPETWPGDTKRYFSKLDRLHPSEFGYMRWGERIANYIGKHVKVNSKEVEVKSRTSSL